MTSSLIKKYIQVVTSLGCPVPDTIRVWVILDVNMFVCMYITAFASISIMAHEIEALLFL